MNVSELTDKVTKTASETAEQVQERVVEIVRSVTERLPELPFSDEVREWTGKVSAFVDEQVDKQRRFVKELVGASQLPKAATAKKSA